MTDDIAQVDLFAEDAVHELPFSPTGTPIRFTREQMRASMWAPGPARLVDRSLVRMDIEESTDGATVLAEYAITGTLVATGQPVSVAGVMVITARDGLIVRAGNYLNRCLLVSKREWLLVH